MSGAFRASGILLALGLLVGCATSGTPRGWSDELLSAWQPPDGQTCSASEQPAVLPPPQDVVDSEALEVAIREALPGVEGYVLFSIRQDSTGTWDRVAPIESDLAPGDQIRLSELLLPRLSTAPQPGLRLRLQLADEVAMAVGRQQHCAPAIANRAMYSRELEALRRGYTTEAEVILVTLVRADGTPSEMRLTQGSGNPQMDADILRSVSRLHFHPGLQDRIVWEAWIQLPIYIRNPSRR